MLLLLLPSFPCRGPFPFVLAPVFNEEERQQTTVLCKRTKSEAKPTNKHRMLKEPVLQKTTLRVNCSVFLPVYCCCKLFLLVKNKHCFRCILSNRGVTGTAPSLGGGQQWLILLTKQWTKWPYSSDQNTWMLARFIIYSFAHEIFQREQCLNKSYQHIFKCHFSHQNVWYSLSGGQWPSPSQ